MSKPGAWMYIIEDVPGGGGMEKFIDTVVDRSFMLTEETVNCCNTRNLTDNATGYTFRGCTFQGCTLRVLSRRGYLAYPPRDMGPGIPNRPVDRDTLVKTSPSHDSKMIVAHL